MNKKNVIKISDHFNYIRLLSFTIPAILRVAFISIFSVVDDGLFVSNFVGKEAFVSINIMAPIATIIYAISFMIETGGNALVSKTLGERNIKKANQYFSMITYFSIIIGVIITILGWILLKPFCLLLGAKEGVLTNCLIYGRIYLPFAVAFLLQDILQNMLITAEKPKLALMATILSGVSNIIFDIVLIVILKLGVIGAVCATLSGEILGVIIPLSYFLFSKESKLKLVKTKIDFKVIGKTCFNGLSELISNLSNSIVTLVFNYKLMKLAGNDGVAAYGVMMYISFFFEATFLGYSSGVAPIVGYNYGSRNKNELKNIFKKSICIVTAIGGMLVVLSEITAIPFSKIFVSYDTQLLNMTVRGLRIYSICFLFMGINLFASSFFTALNNGIVSGVISFLRTFFIEIVTILILPMFFGLNGIWYSTIVSEILSLLITIIAFVKMNKKYGYY